MTAMVLVFYFAINVSTKITPKKVSKTVITFQRSIFANILTLKVEKCHMVYAGGFLLNSQVFTESCAFLKGFQTFKAFYSFDASFGSILREYRSFATVHYSLVATSAVFAKLKQFKVICLGNRHTDTWTHTHTHTH